MALYPSDTPTFDSQGWRMVPLYHVSKTGAILFWEVSFDVPTSTLNTMSGTLVKKALVVSLRKDPTFLKETFLNDALNIPHNREEVIANVTKIYPPVGTAYAAFNIKYKSITPLRNFTVIDQGILECRSLRKKHADKHSATDDFDGLLRGTYQASFRVQLANVYHFPDHEDYDKKQISEAQWTAGLLAQTKEDGNHLVFYRRDDSIVAETRTGQSKAWLFEIKEQINLLLQELPEGTYIDGEITHPEGLQKLRTVMGRSKTRNVDGESLLVFHVFDIYIPPAKTGVVKLYSLERRMNLLDDAFAKVRRKAGFVSGKVELLPSTECHSVEELRRLFDRLISQGKEGLMIRKLSGKNDALLADSLYVPGGRTSNMLKIKPFQDEEGTIVDMDVGVGTYEGCAILIIQRENGDKFRLSVHGSIEEKRQVYSSKKEYIGRVYKYRFTGKTDDGLPREARGIDFRDDGI